MMRGAVSERRARTRYPIERPVRYRHLRGAFINRIATGMAIDASSNGVLLEAGNLLNVGDPLEVLIDWPAQLGGSVPLQLVTEGRVVRIEGTRCAVTVERYEFRIRSNKKIAIPRTTIGPPF